MTNFEEKLKKVSRSVEMTAKERGSIKARLVKEISADTMPAAVSLYSPNAWLFIRKHTLSVAFVAIIFFGGSLSTIAEGTLPGDILYPLKVGVNEEVRGWFATSNTAKSEWQISLAERRLDEVEKLQEAGSLSDDSRQEIEEKIEEHARKAEESVSADEAETNASVSISEAGLMKTSAPTAEESELTTTQALESSFVAQEEPVSQEIEEVSVDSRESLKNLRIKIGELKLRLRDLQDDKVFEIRSKARLMLVRARENLFKADALLLKGEEENARELLKKAEENISKAENIVKDFEDRVQEVEIRSEVKGVQIEEKGEDEKDQDVVR
ncbi:MAG: hypothetical protein A2741_02215 [Candidatus Zambryskibacteria bacterium RIFCSPHIGHO2_01_FULL_43_27]|uniref:DUF5667 domain-containing protein n=1 Tax=Candidatus Zambryskibacteria bacterium RIFCSPLOWO2_01_FULL_43_17 TaxID=1802760 RepID=A0A1G2U4Y2_9BACT|nr:MAG: hypothetical protein A2741_02215 [Candidatus Zambryskibacteria bacterium RIFCSPHIGHO2_01_FULL_43_27]OHB00495.1 MAG: hypothetical protein A3E93_01705 [Candidatus Zambryskibacteria bacterium RIFCSPHIGHO2_12_FULL_43_12b]OHB04556.1 MAG: hypothetical protein A2920_01255 [Candidatus Zambryskibacteria bacterium RIFCSPLOWO2_01_FULL_43_17]